MKGLLDGTDGAGGSLGGRSWWLYIVVNVKNPRGKGLKPNASSRDTGDAPEGEGGIEK